MAQKRAKPKVKKETDEAVRTLQTRLRGEFPQLDDLAIRYQGAKRTVYARCSGNGRPFSELKEASCATFALPARMFNAIDRDLTGMVKGLHEKSKFDLAHTADQIEQIEKAIKRLDQALEQKDLSNEKRKQATFKRGRKRQAKPPP